jgi:hypothetical protein
LALLRKKTRWKEREGEIYIERAREVAGWINNVCHGPGVREE